MIMPHGDAPDGLIDIEALAAPLGGARGTGADPRFDPAYKAIIEARREENARLPQGVWTRDVKRADWKLAERSCIEVLTSRGKDLRVACWLIEALTRRAGFAAVAPGLGLLATLCDRFWEGLHPAIDDGDLTARLAPFEWLNARLPVLLRDVPVVRAAGSPETTYTWTDYVNARLLDGLRQRDPKSVERSEAGGAVTMAAFVAARDRTETWFWRRAAADLRAATASLAELNATLARQCGADAPGLGGIEAALSDLASLIGVALSERQGSPAAAASRAPAAAMPAQAAPRAPAAAAPSRQSAYRDLANIAELLRRIEPHSPVPYLISRAVEWGALPFPELMARFANAGLDLAAVFELLGLAEWANASDPAAADHDDT